MTARHRDISKVRRFAGFSRSAKLQATFTLKPWGRLRGNPPFQRDAGLWSYISPVFKYSICIPGYTCMRCAGVARGERIPREKGKNHQVYFTSKISNKLVYINLIINNHIASQDFVSY